MKEKETDEATTKVKKGLEINQEDIKMQEQADTQDQEIEKEIERLKKENEKLSNFKKLMSFTHPKGLLFVGPLGSMIVGSAMPLIGVILSFVLGYLVTPM